MRGPDDPVRLVRAVDDLGFEDEQHLDVGRPAPLRDRGVVDLRSVGGDGIDVFRYQATSEGGDTVLDFVSGTDKFQFYGADFAGMETGTVDASHFAASSAALGNHAGFVYDAARGSLAYDADGAGAGGAAEIALLGVNHTLQASDIFIG